MAVSANKNISSSGGKISLMGKTENASSNAGNVFCTSESSGCFSWAPYKTLVWRNKIYNFKLLFLCI